MKIIISKSILLKHLQTLGGIIATSNSLPILDNFLFEVNKTELKITACDLESTMTCVLEIEPTENGVFAVQGKMLIDILKTLPEQPLILDLKANNILEIITGSGNYEIGYLDGREYPKAIVLENPSTVSLPSKVLSNAISKTVFATGNDDLRPIMTGVYFQFSTEGLIFVATNAHKLVKYTRTDVKANQEAKFIMPKKPLSVLKGILGALDIEVKIEYNESNSSFSFENYILNCRLIDGKYPNYERVIPKDNPNKLVLDRAQLLNSVNCVSVFSNRLTRQVVLRISGAELNVNAEDLDYSNKAEERLTCNYQGVDITIGFNSKYLIEMLRNLECRDVQLEMSMPNRAGILTPIDSLEEAESLMMLLMPVQLNK